MLVVPLGDFSVAVPKTGLNIDGFRQIFLLCLQMLGHQAGDTSSASSWGLTRLASAPQLIPGTWELFLFY